MAKITVEHTEIDAFAQNEIIEYTKTSDIFFDAKQIVNASRKHAYKVADQTLTIQNWLLGRRIAEEILDGKERADYGAEVIKNLAKKLTAEFGKGFTKNNLYYCKQFYDYFPDIFHAVSGKSYLQTLSWTHFRILLQVSDSKARDWYLKEAAEQTWSSRTLQRNISTQYYHRLLSSSDKEKVQNEMQAKTAEFQADKLEFIKNPVIAEFLGLVPNSDFSESELEKAIITNIQKFLMEMGKGYAFVARQQHIHTEKEDYSARVLLVFAKRKLTRTAAKAKLVK